MAKIISIKLKKVGVDVKSFDIKDSSGDVIMSDVEVKRLINGISVTVDDNETVIKLLAKGNGCSVSEKNIPLKPIPANVYFEINTDFIRTSSIWKHDAMVRKFNSFYGKTEPYVLEGVVSHGALDNILSDVTDISRVYRYSLSGIRIQEDLAYFNKSVIYNDQQCSGLLELVPKPIGNMKEQLSYPKYKQNSKEILFTKSDNIYRYNTFWDVVKNLQEPFFVNSCKSKSYDKELNDENLDYSTRSFNKSRIRGKYVKVRHILDNRDDINIVNTIMITNTKPSIK